MHDTKCFDLARHFLGDEAPDGLVYDLAEWIQQNIEDWIEIERRQRLKRLFPATTPSKDGGGR